MSKFGQTREISHNFSLAINRGLGQAGRARSPCPTARAGLLRFPLLTSGMKQLDQQERLIVRQLIRDPRESDNGIGELTGVNVRTVGRKRQRMEQSGVLSY